MSVSSAALPARARAALASLGCSRAEALALLVLASGTLAGLALLWFLVAAETGEGVGTGGGADVVPTSAAEPGVHGVADGLVAAAPDALVVHVAGRVVQPGLQRLPAGARVADALEAAGGPTDDAALDAINLARLLNDGEQLLVPGIDDMSASAGGDAGPAGPSAFRPDGTLDLNRASQADLETLPGVGPVTAARIVEHREQHGPFTVLGDLRLVQGIGEKTFQSLVDLLSL
jgi:competence protein ComEA